MTKRRRRVAGASLILRRSIQPRISSRSHINTSCHQCPSRICIPFVPRPGIGCRIHRTEGVRLLSQILQTTEPTDTISAMISCSSRCSRSVWDLLARNTFLRITCSLLCHNAIDVAHRYDRGPILKLRKPDSNKLTRPQVYAVPSFCRTRLSSGYAQPSRARARVARHLLCAICVTSQ